MAVTITRKDRTAGELRAVAAKCKDAKAALWMLSIAMVLGSVPINIFIFSTACDSLSACKQHGAEKCPDRI
ncbi:hypothetical protein ACROSR_13790 [Roseovarius tibetensis]